MYIMHIPILWWAVSWPIALVRYGYVLAVITFSCIVYAVLEEPANRWIRSLAGGKQSGRGTPARSQAAAA
jgi:peptidoglycan/LPS O-acetylase OafA/YrhL